MEENKKIENKNLELYNMFRSVPENAKKEIKAGRLKGMTDVNPMFRIKLLTEQFGVCGFGWYPEITKQWLEQGADGVISAFVNINLYIKYNGEWSKPICGTGGSTFVAKELKGLYTDDEAYKKAFTDAISVACKNLGMCADVYYDKDVKKFETKYDNLDNDNSNKNKDNLHITAEQKAKFNELGITEESAIAYCKVKNIDEILKVTAEAMIKAKQKRVNK